MGIEEQPRSVELPIETYSDPRLEVVLPQVYDVLALAYEEGQQTCERVPENNLFNDHTFAHILRTVHFGRRLMEMSTYENEDESFDDELAVVQMAMLIHDLGIKNGRQDHEAKVASNTEDVLTNISESPAWYDIQTTALRHNGAAYRRLLRGHTQKPYQERCRLLIAGMFRKEAAAHNADKLDLGPQRVNRNKVTRAHIEQAELQYDGVDSLEHALANLYIGTTGFTYDEDNKSFIWNFKYQPFYDPEDGRHERLEHLASDVVWDVDGKQMKPFVVPEELKGEEGAADLNKVWSYLGNIMGDKVRRVGEISNVLFPGMKEFKLFVTGPTDEPLFEISLTDDNFDEFFIDWINNHN
ncbi:MAG: hypothetical protein ACEQSA_04630 [Weeksellaceae bacterium]